MAKYKMSEVDIDEIIEEQAPQAPIFDVTDDTIYIFDDIEDNIALEVVKGIKTLEQSDCKEITVVINSNGGLASAAFAICDAMLTCKKPVRTIGTGKIMSAAIPILASGTKGKRFVHKNAIAMIHQVSVAPPTVSASEAQALHDTMDILMENYIDISTRLSKAAQKKQFLAIMDKNVDFYEKSQFLIDLGMADAIADKKNV